jgi:predicted amidohydrolase YtcJ
MKMKMPVLVLTILIMFTGCIKKEKADLILINGAVYTVDSVFTMKQAFAVADGIFLATGSNEEIMDSYDADLIIDAGGKPVYPGLIDGHCHFVGYAANRYQGVNLRGTYSFDEILELLNAFHQKNPDAWIVGFGWDQNDWEVKMFPDKSELDRLFPQNPVVLTRIDGHAVLANSPALLLAGINKETKITGGKVILKDGQPSGILLDNAADRMKSMVPKPGDRDKMVALTDAQHDCFRLGLTSVVDAGLYYNEVLMVDTLQQSGKLKLRINAMLTPDGMNMNEFVKKGTFQKERLTVNSIKLYADGALGSRGALLLEPYADDPGNYGLRMSDMDYYREILALAYEKGFQVNTHCIGDSANRMMLNLYGEVLRGINDRRWRIEHAQVIHPDDFRLFEQFSVIPSIQSTHCTSDMYWAGERLGPERVKGAYAYNELLQQNGWLINGTDFPVEEINPMLTFFAVVARMDKKGYPEGGFQMENALSREEALRSMTIWAAKGSFEEDVKGSIEAGKFADFVILDRDIMSVNVAEIPGTIVLKTYLNGELVFE